jgi:polyhydroxyalkanoate synthesis regulator phasin
VGIFLVGAYQEILGDLHNLFGDTDTVHVDLDTQGQFRIVDRLQGEPVGKVLSYVGYNEEWLMNRYDKALARLVEKGDLTQAEADEVRDDLIRGLKGNTYLTARSVRAVREADFAEKEEAVPPEGVPVPTTAPPSSSGNGNGNGNGEGFPRPPTASGPRETVGR